MFLLQLEAALCIPIICGGLLLFAGIAVILYLVSIYNGLVLLRNNINESWANIDVLLKQRYDELPKLLDTCSAYMKYEKKTLQDITALRTQLNSATSVAEKGALDARMHGALMNLFAVAENYPELKANQNFLQLQNRVSTIESQIADRREFFNDATNNFNIRIASIPDMFVAAPMGLKRMELFKAAEAERADVKMKFDMPA